MPVEVDAEKRMTFTEASRHLESRKTGCNVAPTTLRKWATKGSKGIRLATIMTPGGMRVRMSDIEAFFQALTEQAGCYVPPPVKDSGVVNQRLQAARAGIRSITG